MPETATGRLAQHRWESSPLDPADPTSIRDLPQAEIDTVRQTVVALGVSTGLVYELLRNGPIPAKRPGRHWVIPAPGSTPGSTQRPDQKAPNQPRDDVG